MHKLLNLMLLVTLIVTACFVTGCGNTDDDWKTSNPISDEPVLAFTFGVDQSGSLPVDARATIYCPPTITIDGVPFNQNGSLTGNNVTYYTGNLQKANITRIVSAGFANLVFDQTSYKISYEFFRQAYYGAAANVQPTAKLIVIPGFSVKSAEINGNVIEKTNASFPKVTPIEAPDTKVKVALSADQETVTITVPSSVGVVSEYTAWTIVFYDNTVDKNKAFAKGEYDKYYDEVPSNGNTLRLIITSAGKELMTKGHKYTGVLATLRVKLTDGTTKDLDVSQCVIDNVIWNQ